MKGYITPETCLSVLGWDVSDASLFTDVSLLIPYVEEAIDAFTQTRFDYQSNHTYTYNGNGRTHISLGWLLEEITSVWVLDDNGERSYELTDVVPQPSSPVSGIYRWIERRNNQVFPEGLNNIEVVGKWGFQTIPKSVEIAAAMAVKHLMNMRPDNELVQREGGFAHIMERISNTQVDVLPQVSKALLRTWTSRRWAS